jgi:hypothetical protein
VPQPCRQLRVWASQELKHGPFKVAGQLLRQAASWLAQLARHALAACAILICAPFGCAAAAAANKNVKAADSSNFISILPTKRIARCKFVTYHGVPQRGAFCYLAERTLSLKHTSAQRAKIPSQNDAFVTIFPLKTLSIARTVRTNKGLRFNEFIS